MGKVSKIIKWINAQNHPEQGLTLADRSMNINYFHYLPV